MKIHFVSIEVCIVRRCHRQIQTESRVRQDLDQMTHDGHLVKRGLSVEEHIVAVLQVPLNLVADLQVDVRPIPQHREVNLSLVMPDDVLGAGPLRGSVHDQ